MSRRSVAVFTSSRADLGPLGPVVEALDRDRRVELTVLATGTHGSEVYGGRLQDISLSGDSRLEILDAGFSDTRPGALGESYGRLASAVSSFLDRRRVDVLVLLGDRWELLAAAGPALLYGVPIAHLHGGETTEGAMDERVRHGVTKLADLHLCATEDSARRIRRLGEEAWRIVVTGAPGLDRLVDVEPLAPARLEELLGGPVERPLGVVVYHPPTVERGDVGRRARDVFGAASEVLGSCLALYPGADPGSEEVIAALEAAVDPPRFAALRNLGEEYVPLLAAADVLVGNSSSGIIEAASLSLPVVDVGERQQGRLRSRNVLQVGEGRAAVVAGLRHALAPSFRDSLAGLVNPYGDGAASRRIVEALVDAPLERLKRKPLIETPPDVSLEALTVSPGASLRRAMEGISRGRCQLVFVVGGDGRLEGTLSDGDVRRALLGGAALEDPLTPFVNRVPVMATCHDEPGRILQLMESNSITQIPVVDDDGVLVGVHVMRAIVGQVLDGSISPPAEGA